MEKIYQRLGGTYCLHLQGKRVGSSDTTEDQYARFGALMAVKVKISIFILKLEAASLSQTLITF
jgi:hypothetical protein